MGASRSLKGSVIMALANLLFTDIVINATPINPGAGGWDTLLNSFMSDQRGRTGFGLLSRITDIQPATGSGSVLITATTGWRCMPILVNVLRDGNTPTGLHPQFDAHRIIAGDDLARNVFTVESDSGADVPLSFFTYGFAWPSAD